MGDFKKLKVWQISRELARDVILKCNANSAFNKDFRFRDQIRAAAVSIVSNIAEGEGSGSDAQSIRYFYYAKGSSAELHAQLILAKDINYLDKDSADKLINSCEMVSIFLSKIIQHRSKKSKAS